MITEILTIMLPVLLCAAIGYGWAYSGFHFDSEFVSRLVLNIGMPCLMLSALSAVEIDPVAFSQTALACVIIAVLMTGLGILIPYCLGHDIRAYLPSFVFPNVGNMGLPMSVLAFGPEGLAYALGFFMVLSIAHFPAGMLLAGGRSAGGWMVLVKMPMMYAIAMGVIMVWQGWQLPGLVSHALDMVGGMAVPLMLIALGVSLQRLRISQWKTSLFYSLMRIAGGFGVGWLVCEWLALEGVVRGVVLLQSTMPVAVFNYLFAERFKREPEAVAGMVVVSTLLSFATLPALLAWLI